VEVFYKESVKFVFLPCYTIVYLYSICICTVGKSDFIQIFYILWKHYIHVLVLNVYSLSNKKLSNVSESKLSHKCMYDLYMSKFSF